ncbi:MAG TPA: hypothetical protein EYQ50_21690 [Verrucomicrobiales bacterium]|jgi:predicted thioesterase|nr:hypothetical protein [Verrucomicrobiales bacterium]HIL72123.1 hypothetical protein [Verrucomicrobiota bacterium]
MKKPLKTGTEHHLTFTVKPEHGIDFADESMPAVLSTPWLIWQLEHTARGAVLPFLEQKESTVGTHLDIEHLAPTPLGMEVTCRARIIFIDGPVVSFQLEAWDSSERIAKGTHKLRIIEKARLQRRVERKS